MAWLRHKKINTSLQRTPHNQEVFERMKDALAWLNANTYTTRILKWKTDEWGEIPADFGRK